MGITTYASSTGALTGTTTILPPGVSFAISGFSYTNPNVTVTTTTNHTFQVGNIITMIGVVQNGTTQLQSGSRQITAVTANTFTYNLGVTAPSTYVSGGIVMLNASGDPHISAYLNGRYILALGQGTYAFSQDGINWTIGQVPSAGQQITSMTYDGTNYIFACGTQGIWTSSNLAQGSWTQRSTFGGFFVHHVAWYGGNIQRSVAVGSNDTTVAGTGGRIETATVGGTSWTNQTISGTASTQAYRGSDWDGNNTIIATPTSAAMAISTAGAGSWTGVAQTSTTRPGSTANIPTMNFNSTPMVRWNPTAAKWMSFSDNSNSTGGVSSTTTPSSPWTKGIPQDFFTGKAYSSSGGNGNGSMYNLNQIVIADGFIYTTRFDGPELQIFKWSATPTDINTHIEIYPLVDFIRTSKIPTQQMQNSATGITGTSYSVVYGNGKWVVCQSNNQQNGLAANYTVTILQ